MFSLREGAAGGLLRRAQSLKPDGARSGERARLGIHGVVQLPQRSLKLGYAGGLGFEPICCDTRELIAGRFGIGSQLENGLRQILRVSHDLPPWWMPHA